MVLVASDCPFGQNVTFTAVRLLGEPHRQGPGNGGRELEVIEIGLRAEPAEEWRCAREGRFSIRSVVWAHSNRCTPGSRSERCVCNQNIVLRGTMPMLFRKRSRDYVPVRHCDLDFFHVVDAVHAARCGNIRVVRIEHVGKRGVPTRVDHFEIEIVDERFPATSSRPEDVGIDPAEDHANFFARRQEESGLDLLTLRNVSRAQFSGRCCCRR